MHNDTDHRTQHPAAVAVVELVEPVAAGAAGKDRKPWSKDKLGDCSALPQVASTSYIILAKITNGRCCAMNQDRQSP